MLGKNKKLDNIIKLLEDILEQGKESYYLIKQRDRNADFNHLKWLKEQVEYHENLQKIKEEFNNHSNSN